MVLLNLGRHMCPINPLFCTLRVRFLIFFLLKFSYWFQLFFRNFFFFGVFELFLTEAEFNKVQLLLSAGESWVNVGVQICKDPEKLRKYFGRLRTKTNLIYSQRSDYNGVEWNRPTQMWLVRLKGVFIGRFSEESRAALVVDSIYADIFPRSSKWLPRNLGKKKSGVYQRTLATVKNWECKKYLLRRVTYSVFCLFGFFFCSSEVGKKVFFAVCRYISPF